jgi:kynureninase
MSKDTDAWRSRFVLPANQVYLDGNSLGALPKGVMERVQQVIAVEWGTDLIQSWNKHGWIDLPARVGAKIARLIGAMPQEVVAADSTSLNLFKVLLAALKLQPERKVIVSEIGNFPTDLYIAEGINQLLGGEYELRFIESNQLAAAIDESVAVVMLTQVDYRTGALLDMQAITALARSVGALTIWDLSHSAGVIPLSLSAWGVDFAIGCGYKFLCGGPGAPAFLYVAERHHLSAQPALSGWMGHAEPFAFVPNYTPSQDIRRLTVGTPNVIALSALDTALEVFAGIEMADIRAHSLVLTTRFIELMQPLAQTHDLTLVTPLAAHQRGSQVSYASQHGYPMMRAIIEAGVVGDFRAPDIMRFGFAALYLSLADIDEAVRRIALVLERGIWREERFAGRNAVT